MLGVSEATVKRWSDAGLPRCFRTPGGHRKFRREDVADFLASYKTGNLDGLDARTDPRDPRSVSSGRSDALLVDAKDPAGFRAAALASDVDGLVSQIARSRLGGRTLASIFDDVVTPALEDIGERWARGALTVSQEHLAGTTVIEALARTRPLIERTGHDRGSILLACPGEELHDIALRMASLLAFGLGFRAMLVGARVPVADLCLLITGERPRVVGISASMVTDPRERMQELAAISATARSVHAVTLIGGRGYADLPDRPPGARLVRTMTALVDVLDAL